MVYGQMLCTSCALCYCNDRWQGVLSVTGKNMSSLFLSTASGEVLSEDIHLVVVGLRVQPVIGHDACRPDA